MPKQGLKVFSNGIGTKIILPYLLLTLVVAGIGAFIVTNLVTGSLQERVNNQLLDAGRVVAESMVGYEQERLEVLRLIAFTTGVAEAVAAGNTDRLTTLVPPIIANSQTDAVILLNQQGIELFGWESQMDQPHTGRDLSELEDVRLVLEGFEDELGTKRALLGQTADGFMLYTIGPVYQGAELVGAVMVGTHLHNMAVALTENAVARVTLYDQNGQVMATTLGDDPGSVAEILRESPERYETIINLLQKSPELYQGVVAGADSQVPLEQVEVLNQRYLLAYGDWRVRNRSFGLFSVALPSNFIVNTAVTSRNILGLVFSLSTIAVITLGFLLAQRITRPINRLVEVSTAVAEGNLNERTGITADDELGTLAASFDTMTERLLERDRQLVEQASKLKAILHSIADGVIVFDMNNHIVSSNTAARRILNDASRENFLRELLSRTVISAEINPLDVLYDSQRYQVGSQFFSALAAPVRTPDGDQLGRVLVLRDVTREAEAEQLKDGFIAGISHELRTPLTSIKGYIDLMLLNNTANLDMMQLKFLKTVSNNTTQLINHVDKLIDIAQVQQGVLTLNKQRKSLGDLAAKAVRNWEKPMADKGLTLHFRQPPEPVWVCGDDGRLIWAIDNLLRNAYQYTPGEGQVDVTISRQSDLAHVVVKDTGIGISATDQPHLFGRFFRIQHESTFDVPGLGLGLFIVRSIVEAHNGQVQVQSELGVGSTFGFVMPVME